MWLWHWHCVSIIWPDGALIVSTVAALAAHRAVAFVVEAAALAAALAFGIVRNLKRNFPVEELTNRKAVIGSGNAVRLLQCIQYAIKQEFALPLKLASGKEEAACGVAIQALSSIQQ